MFDSFPTGGPEGVRALAQVAARSDVTLCREGDLLEVFAELEAAGRALDAARAHVAAELERRKVTERHDGLRTAGSLAFRHGLPRADAGALVRTGAFLDRHPVIDRALVDGVLSLAHVTFLARVCTPRVATTVELIQEQLVDLARGTRFDTWARDVRGLLALADTDGAEPPAPGDNELVVTPTGDGAVVVRGELVGEWAVEFRAALDAEADRLFRRLAADAEVTGEPLLLRRPQLLALALVELVRQGRAAGHAGRGPVADVTVVLTTPPELADRLRAPSEGESDAQWMARLTAELLDAHTPGGDRLHPSTAGLLCCDGHHRVLVENFTGETLAFGRSRRLASGAQRRAAAIRYGGCCFPGCDAPPDWCDLHHSPSWEAGGTTDLDHLAPLCRHHHGVVHRAGWSMAPDPEVGFTITTPSGRTLPVQQRGRPPDRPPPPA